MKNRSARSRDRIRFDEPVICELAHAGPPLPDLIPPNVVPVLSTREKLRLYRKAKELNVVGRARMSEGELRDAIGNMEHLAAL